MTSGTTVVAWETIRPYIESHGDTRILELPIHWSLDDAPYFLYTLDDEGQLRSPQEVFKIWEDEVLHATVERRHITFVMHPEIIGRGPQMLALDRFVEMLTQQDDIWIAPHREIAALFSPI
jgi:hypothetical protein